MKLTRPAFAKTNLFLTVPGRLESGYHLIRTLIVPLELSDSVTIEIENGPENGAGGGETPDVTCTTILSEQLQEHLSYHKPAESAPASPPAPELIAPLHSGGNICIKAARLLLEQLQEKRRVKITLTKRVPIGAGLGGGSADGAAVLTGLAELLGASISEDELCALGAKLGSDVPAAILARPVLIYGTGGRWVDLGGAAPNQAGSQPESLLRPEVLRVLEQAGVVVVKPPYPVMTETAYYGLGHRPELPAELAERDDYRTDPRALAQILAVVRRLPCDQASDFTEELTSPTVDGNSEADWSLFQNDFETSVFGRHPDLGRLAQSLSSGGAFKSFLSGSGSSIIGLFPSPEDGAAWVERFRASERFRTGEFRGAFVQATRFRLKR